jgi:hypothetical protein
VCRVLWCVECGVVVLCSRSANVSKEHRRSFEDIIHHSCKDEDGFKVGSPSSSHRS